MNELVYVTSAMTDVPLFGYFEVLKHAVETATGWVGLTLVWVYSFLVATVLPIPIQVVLLAPLELGVSLPVRLAIISVVSSTGTTAGSLFASGFGKQFKEKAVTHLPDRITDAIDRGRRRIGSAGARVRGATAAVGRRVTAPLPWSDRLGSDTTAETGESDSRAERLVKNLEYKGLFIALCIPMFPHKVSVYAAGIFDPDFHKLGVTVLAGSLGRLVVSIALASGALTLL